jgi:hypothetical protein
MRSAEIIAGTCAAPAASVVLLADIAIPNPTAGETPVGISVTTVDQSLERLESNGLAVTIIDRTTGTDQQAACGAIVGTPIGVDLFVGLASASPATEAGVAWLHDNGNGTTTITIFFSLALLNGAPASGTPEAG